MLPEIRFLVRAGAAVHLLRKRSKVPLTDKWSTAPRAMMADLEEQFRKGMNVGVRLGKPSKIDGRYLHAIDLDVRKDDQADEAHDKLVELFGDEIYECGSVISGSGGESRHYYFLTDRPYSSRKLATSGVKFEDDEGRKHYTWEIELFGTGKQCALPPSIHPDSGKPYRWENKPDFLVDDYHISTEVIDRALADDEDDDYDDVDNEEPLGISYEEADEILADLPQEWADDRDTWIKAGMALHHEFEGSEEAYDCWVTFSKRSRKYEKSVARQQWRSFKNSKKRIVTMRSVAKAAGDAVRRAEAMAGFDELDDLDDEDEIIEDGSEVTRKMKDDDKIMSLLKQSPFDAPKFPSKIFGKFWEKHITSMAENAASPEDFVGAALIAAVGGIVGNAMWVSPRPGWEEPPILWCQVIGPPSANKSPALRPFISILDELEQSWEPQFMEIYRQWRGERDVAAKKMKIWEAKISKQIEDGEDTDPMPHDAQIPPEPTQRRAFITDATMEAVKRIFVGNPRGFLSFRDEMAAWYHNLSRYSGGSDRGDWLEAYGGGKTRIDRVKDGGKTLKISQFSIGILGGIQPERLDDMLSSADDGLQARFISFWPEETFRPFSDGKKRNYAVYEAFEHLANITPKSAPGQPYESRVMKFSRTAMRRFGKWVDQHTMAERFAPSMISGAYGKANGHVARLALILELLWWAPDGDEKDMPKEVSDKAVKAAIKFREEYIKPMQKRTFGHAYQNEQGIMAKSIATWIADEVPEVVNLRTLRRSAGIKGISSRTDVDSIEEAVGYLVQMRWLKPIEVEKRSRGGQRKDFEVNPRVYELLAQQRD